jgi:hypothetical protein
MDPRMVIRSASISRGPRTISCRCNTVHFIQLFIAWSEEDGSIDRKGKKQLAVEESQWKQMAEAVALVMWPAVEESFHEMVAD